MTTPYTLIDKHATHLVINKAPLFTTVSSDIELDSVESRIKKDFGVKTLHFPQRIDTPVSGVLMVLLKPSTKYTIVEKRYMAICEKADIAKEGELTHYIQRDGKAKKARITTAEHGKEARLRYSIIHELDNYYVIDIELLTGRFHQIRCQLAAIGVPIKGDVKYGARRRNADRSLYLHSYYLSVNVDNAIKSYSVRPPADKLWDLAWTQIESND